MVRQQVKKKIIQTEGWGRESWEGTTSGRHQE